MPMWTHFDAIVYFICKMDLEMLEAFLDEAPYYLENKEDFLVRMGKAFAQITGQGNSQLIIDKRKTKSFSIDKFNENPNPTIVIYHKFIGNKTRHYLGLKFEINEFKRVVNCMDEFRFSSNEGFTQLGKYHILLCPEFDQFTTSS